MLADEIICMIDKKNMTEVEFSAIESKIRRLNSEYVEATYNILKDNAVADEYKKYFGDESTYNYFIGRLKEVDIKTCYSLIALLFQCYDTSAAKYFNDDLDIIIIIGLIGSMFGEDKFPYEDIEANLREMLKTELDEVTRFLAENKNNPELVEKYVNEYLI